MRSLLPGGSINEQQLTLEGKLIISSKVEHAFLYLFLDTRRYV
jgi:hypothetical protein